MYVEELFTVLTVSDFFRLFITVPWRLVQKGTCHSVKLSKNVMGQVSTELSDPKLVVSFQVFSLAFLRWRHLQEQLVSGWTFHLEWGRSLLFVHKSTRNWFYQCLEKCTKSCCFKLFPNSFYLLETKERSLCFILRRILSQYCEAREHIKHICLGNRF